MDKRNEIRSAKTRRKIYPTDGYAQEISYRVADFLVERLPVFQQIKIKESIHPKLRLDYEKTEIYLHADSSTLLKRATSCRKEPSTVAWLEKQTREGDIVYDIGANVGAYSLIAAKQNGKNITVYAFEPSFSTYRELCANIILNGCQNSIVPCINPLAEKTGPSVFHYQSVQAGSALHALGENIDHTGAAFESVYSQNVISFSLDDLVQKFAFPVPHLIKVDVDGIELDILRGAQKTLDDWRVRSLLVEIDNDAPEDREARIVAFLAERGFYLATQKSHGSIVKNFIFQRANGENSSRAKSQEGRNN